MSLQLRAFTFILVSLPVLSYFLQRFFSVQVGALELFSRHIMVNYADWLFIPFNLFVLFAMTISRKKLLIFLSISCLLNIGTNFYWSGLSAQGLIRSHLFVLDSGQMTAGGVVHLLFSWFQAGLVGLFFFYSKHNKYAIYCLISLIGYAATLIYGSYTFHNGNPLMTDLVLSAFLFVLIAYKFYAYKVERTK